MSATRRSRFLRWLRETHAWLGLWGAAMGLFFGATGIVMNHRAVLKIPLKKFEQSVIRLELDTPAATPESFARSVAARLSIDPRAARITVEPARDVVWEGREVRQPERWQAHFDGPARFARAEYWSGDRTAVVTSSKANLIATLTRLHQAIGVNAVWVLAIDVVAGSLILLAITGLLLWTQMRPWRLSTLAVALGAAAFAAWGAISAL